jgi:hypothetical protein
MGMVSEQSTSPLAERSTADLTVSRRSVETNAFWTISAGEAWGADKRSNVTDMQIWLNSVFNLN